ncbi:MAG: M20/M25/M40 family metallo-hydrolase [Myxococcales bacterium]|nr:M20/M25/M40 family metallo-hydrolase [Myxococcales bacterium]
MREVLLLALGVFAGCAPHHAAQTSPKTPAPGVIAKPSGVVPLTGREQATAEELRRDVTELATKLGERNTEKKWELAGAADWLVESLEAAGYAVARDGHEIDGVAVQNLAVEVRGGQAANEIVLVGAHYDTAQGSPGANDNASGVAAVLALARRYKGATPDRTLRFVFFANEEPPYFQTANMGSVLYAKGITTRGEKIAAMLSIESIGVYSDVAGSQRFPAGLSGRYPKTGNFVAVVGNPASKTLVELVADGLNARATLPAVGAALPDSLPEAGWSDHWAFWQIGVPAVMITDTAGFRDDHYHKPTDTPERLDYARAARLVVGLESVIAELTGDTQALLPDKKSKPPPLP